MQSDAEEARSLETKYCLHCCREIGRQEGCDTCGAAAPGKAVEAYPMYLRPGLILQDKYLIGRVLGHGGFGITYLGVDVNLQERVAIKEHLPRDLATRNADHLTVVPYANENETFQYGLSKFLDEARSLARFRDHPNIVTILDYFKCYNTGYLVMVYLEGMPLSDLLKQRGPLSEEAALPIFLSILDGLRAVHAKGMLHRDIKPQNVYLTKEEGQVKLIDFGAAKQATSEHSRSMSSFSPGYSPFEQIVTGGQQGPWTDIYASGATLYKMLTCMDLQESTGRMLRDEIPPLRQVLGEKVTPKLSDAVAKAMALNASERFQTVEAFIDALVGKAIPKTKKSGDEEKKLRITKKEESRKEEIKPPAQSDGSGKLKKFLRIAAIIVLTPLALLGLSFVYFMFSSDSHDSPPVASPTPRSTIIAEPTPIPSQMPGTSSLAMHGLSMISITPGSFQMGLSADEEKYSPDEKQHLVTLARKFKIGHTEVTQELWEAVLGSGANPSKSKGPNLPVENVTWADAIRFCNQLSEKEGLQPTYKNITETSADWDPKANGYRLPTEAEWEFAARGGMELRYPGTDTPMEACWFKDTQIKHAQTVKGKRPNAFGLYDMCGNVSEWVWDWYAPYSIENAPDPVGPSKGEKRVTRGGSWSSPRWVVRAGSRGASFPHAKTEMTGFRLAQSVF